MGLGLRAKAWSVLNRLGYDHRNWLRIKQIEAWEDYLSRLPPDASVLEISPGSWSPWTKYGRYQAASYPEFDIVQDRLDAAFDVVIADQVLEHVKNPKAALKNIRSMVRPGGAALIAMPFLFRVHARPHDFFRWTPEGMHLLCTAAGFNPELIHVNSWGNKACARAHIGGKVKDFGFGRDLTNDPEYPVMVWAICGV